MKPNKLYRLDDFRDRYISSYSFGKSPQLYLLVPIDDIWGITVWIKELN